jgi:4-amino-4-deoxy-L-arabinose transferase-like glycosyltransferase
MAKFRRPVAFSRAVFDSLRQVRWLRAARAGIPVGLVVLGLVCLWPNLSHPAIASWDESGHQAAVRGLFDTSTPTIYRDPLIPAGPGDWLAAQVFLHKPTLPFALGALMMRLFGVTPLALRTVSLIAALATALGMYFIGRRFLGTPLAAVVAAAFLFLPFGFTLVQGYQFGDATDCTLVAFLTLSMWALVVAIERGSIRRAAVAGALCGCAFLCKSALALTPIGVVAALVILGRTRFAPRLKQSMLWATVLAALIVAVPWNLYCAIKWPEVYGFEAKFTLGFLTDRGRMFSKPAIDALFDQINDQELAPWPAALPFVAGVSLLWSALKRRDWRRWLLCLWVWGEWVPLSVAAVKVPAHAWGAVPAALIAVGLLIRDSVEQSALAGAIIAALGTSSAMAFLARHVSFRLLSQGGSPLGRARSNLEVGLVLALLGGVVAYGTVRLWQRHVWLPRVLAMAAAGAVCWVALVQSPLRLRAERTAHRDPFVESYGDQLGRALDRSIPERSVLFVDVARDPHCCFEKTSLIFYSGRMVYKFDDKLVGLARERGYHPYLVSGAARPYRRVESVPASSPWQAFDLDSPLTRASPPPQDMTQVNGWTGNARVIGNAHVIGFAIGRGDKDRDRYVFYLEPTKGETKPPSPTSPASEAQAITTPGLRKDVITTSLKAPWLHPGGAVEKAPVLQGQVVFSVKDGSEERIVLDTSRTLNGAKDINESAWFTMTVPGPLRSKLRRLRLGPTDLPLPAEDGG